MASLLSALLLLLAGISGAADLCARKNPPPPPIQIQAEKTVVCDEGQGVCVADGNVVVTNGALQVYCDQATARFHKEPNVSDKRRLHTLSAAGKVVLTERDFRATGNRLFLNSETKQAWLYGNPRISGEKFYVQSQEPIFWNKEKGIALINHPMVVIPEHQIVVSGKILTVYLKQKGEFSGYKSPKNKFPLGDVGAIKSMTVMGPVLLAGPKDTLRSDNAFFDGLMQKLSFTDNVRHARKGQSMAAQKASFFLEKGLLAVSMASHSREKKPNSEMGDSSKQVK